LDTTIGCCMHSAMAWVSQQMACTWLALAQLKNQTPAMGFAMGLCPAVVGMPQDMASQTSAQHVRSYYMLT